MTADLYDLDRLATAHEREAAWMEMQARAARAEAKRHREAALTLRTRAAIAQIVEVQS